MKVGEFVDFVEGWFPGERERAAFMIALLMNDARPALVRPLLAECTERGRASGVKVSELQLLAVAVAAQVELDD